MGPGRFMPIVATVALGAMSIALVPGIATRATRLLEMLGSLPNEAPWRARALWSAVGAGVVLLLPDRTHFTGDFMLREWAVRSGGAPSQLFPQAFPADVWFHYWLPRWLTAAHICQTDTYARILGAIEAATLGAVGVELSRALRLNGPASCVATAGLLFGAQLTTMTGYAKAVSELALFAAVMAVFGLAAVGQGRGLAWVGLAFAASLLFHRAAVLLLPTYIGFIALADHPSGRERAVAIISPVIAVAIMGATIFRTAVRFDWQAGYFGIPQLRDLALNSLDIFNILLLAPVLVLALTTLSRPMLPARVWILLALPFTALALAIRHSSQGLFRDWDLFAAPAVLLSVAASAQVGGALSRIARPQQWVAASVLVSIIAPALIDLFVQSNLEAGMKRGEAFATEAPRRSPDVRGNVWRFLCGRNVQLERYAEAVRTGREAAALTPNREVLLLLAGSERNDEEHAAAFLTYKRLLGVDENNAEAWYCVALYSAHAGDFSEADHALERLRHLQVPQEIIAYASARIEDERAHRSGSLTSAVPFQF